MGNLFNTLVIVFNIKNVFSIFFVLGPHMPILKRESDLLGVKDGDHKEGIEFKKKSTNL